ncbi:MAG: sulfite exporter TauE/SafE family protein [Armatimonadetes bacterium]|nr:sulfite exporter TauE/SafE family protein [Armatimonadota bacterium]
MIGGVAAGINAVAGGGSLISFPFLTEAIKIPSIQANATNSAALWPGSLAGAFGFKDLLHKTRHYLKLLALPTLVGSSFGAWLLTVSTRKTFDSIIPFLILLASLMLTLQPKIKALAKRHDRSMPLWVGVLTQLLVATYGGYFGAGMGLMMLGSFALYMEGNIHELNAVKNWLGLIVNFAASALLALKGMVQWDAFIFLALGAITGGFFSAKYSQRVDSEKLRWVIALYGFGMTGYFFWRAFFRS